MALNLLIPALAPIIGKVIANRFPDPAEKAKAEAEVLREMMAHQAQIEQAASQIVSGEVASSHWLAANWRPVLMLTFAALIVARWMGWVAPNLSEAEYLKLWSIIELGLGGYVIGRSVEKIAPSIAGAIRK